MAKEDNVREKEREVSGDNKTNGEGKGNYKCGSVLSYNTLGG